MPEKSGMGKSSKATSEASSTSSASPARTSSPASDCGTSRFRSQDGPTTSACGPGVAPVRSPSRDADSAQLTLAICGPSGSGSLASADLQSFLASRLPALLAGRGSTLYRLTWRAVVTPSGRRSCAQRASVRRTRDGDSTGAPWATATARDWRSGEAGPETMAKGGRPLNEVAVNLVPWGQPVPWATPVVNDATGSEYTYSRGDHSKPALKLPGQARLADSGPAQNGSSAATEKRAQLNPRHSRWLMGIPPGWEDCAPESSMRARRR